VIVSEIARALDLRVAAGEKALDREVTAGYSADLLSCVMARAKAGNVWVTLQVHPNVVAVATLLDLAAVIVSEGASIPDEVIAKANAEHVVLLATSHTTFFVVSELARLGLRAQE
jgi:predicted transcriptional regulator